MLVRSMFDLSLVEGLANYSGGRSLDLRSFSSDGYEEHIWLALG